MAALALREELAALEHDRWARWMKHLFNQAALQADGSVVIPPPLVEHWQRQVQTPYADLSEAEKDSDRREAERTLAVLEQHPPLPG